MKTICQWCKEIFEYPGYDTDCYDNSRVCDECTSKYNDEMLEVYNDQQNTMPNPRTQAK